MPRKPNPDNHAHADPWHLLRNGRGAPYKPRPQPNWLHKYLAGKMPNGIVFRTTMGTLRFRSMREVTEETIRELERLGNTVVYSPKIVRLSIPIKRK